MRSNCKAFSQLVIKGERPLVGGTISGLVVLGSIREQAEASQKRTSLHGLCISSCFLTCLSSSPDFLGDEQQHGSVSRINPFLPNLLFGHDVCAGIETLTKTPWLPPGLLCIYFSSPWASLLLETPHVLVRAIGLSAPWW